MPEQPRKRFVVSTHAGLISNENAHFLPPNAAQSLLNVDFVEKGQFSCRQGILPVWPSENPVAPVSYLAIASVGYSTGQAEILVYETRDGALHYSISPATGGSGNIGAPAMRTGLNTFAPMTMVKVPDGFLIGQNGYDRGLFWDGLSSTSYNLGMDAPASAPTVTASSGGNATGGQYLCFVRFIDQYKTASNLSPAATVTASQGDEFAWTIPVSQNPRTTQVELWRTTADENETYYLVETVTNGTTSYRDTMSDDGLEQQAVNDPYFSMANEINGQPNANRFGIPPTWKSVVSWFQDRCFYLADQNYTLGTVSVINGSSTVYGSGVAWPILMSSLYLYVVGATVPYLIDNVTESPLGVTEINKGGGSTNAVQLVTVGSGISGGSFTLSLNGHVTTTIAYNAPATGAGSVQAAIGALPNVGGTANVGVTGNAGGPWTVTFQAALAGTQEPAMVPDSSGLTGLAVTVTELQGGGSSSGVNNAVEVVGFSTANGFITGGEFTLTFNGHTTPPIPALGTTAAQMTTILQALPSIGSGNCSVVKSEDVDYSQEWQITFIGFLAGINVPQMTITCYPTSTSGGVEYTGTIEPENYTQVTGAAGANEIQQIKLPQGVSGGTFKLTWSAQTTGNIAYNCTAQDVTNALISLPAIGNSANIAVTGGLGTFNVVFQGTLGGASQPLITGNGSGLSGGDVTVEVLQGGGSGTSGSQSITLPSATAGTWTITLKGATTTALAWNASAAAVQSALELLGTVGTGNVTVTGTYNTSFTLTFGGSLSGQIIPQCSVDATALCGLAATVVELTAGSSSGGGSGQNEIQQVGFLTFQNGTTTPLTCLNSGGSDGTFTISWNGHTTGAIPVHSPSGVRWPNGGMSPAELMPFLAGGVDLNGVNQPGIPGLAGNITIADGPSFSGSYYGSANQDWIITFTGSLGGAAQPQMTLNASGIGGNVPTGNCSGIAFTVAQQFEIQKGGSGGGSGCTNEVQQITLPNGTSNGSFKITAGGATTGAIAFPTTVASVQSALGANFQVTGSANGPFIITYINSLGCAAQSLATVDTSQLCGGSATTSIITQGAPGGNEQQLILLGCPTGGTYTLSWNGDTTTSLSFDATNTDLQSALNALANIGGAGGNVAVASLSGSADQGGAQGNCFDGPVGTQGAARAFIVTFEGSLGDASQPLITIDSSLSGPTTIPTLTLDVPYAGPTQADATYSIRPAPFERNRVYFCVDEATEILTQRGWLTLDELSILDKALSIDPATKQVHWSDIDNVNVYPFDGELNRWETRLMDALTTDDHRWLAKGRGMVGGHWTIRVGREDETHWTTTAEAQSMFSKRLLLGGGKPVCQDGVFDDDFVELCGWYITEGTDCNKKWMLAIYQSETANPEKSRRIRELCERQAAWGCAFKEYHTEYSAAGETRTMNHFRLGADLARPIKALCPGKELTPDLLMQLSTSQLQLLYDTLIAGDGHVSKEGAHTFTQREALKTTIDSFQMLCAMLGIRSNIHRYDAHGFPQLTACAYRRDAGNGCNMKSRKERYVGRVWCPTTKHGTWMARRNGVTYWTGNSASNEPESVPPTNLVRIQHDQNVDDEIVGAMPFNGALYILKQNHVYSLTYATDPLDNVAIHCVAYRGALNNNCCALAEGVMFLMDEWGAYAFDGNNVTKIGDPIQNYWRDSLIDFTRSKWFYVKATPQDQTVRFFVCFPGFCYPAHAFAYNYRLGTWSLESYFKQAATAAYLNFDGQSRLLLGTTGEVFYQVGEGTLDGTQGVGTIRGTATTATTSAAIFCATTTWPADASFASITIDSGGAKGQTRAIVSANKGLAKLTLDKAFTGQLKGDTYIIGGIPWNYKTPIYRFLEVEDENRRELRVSFIPTDNPATFDTQRFYDHDSSPQVMPQTQPDELWGLSWLEGSPDITADMCNTQSLQTKIVGFVPISDNERLDDRTEGPRWMTYLLRGVQAQDRVKIVGLELFGMETG